jgi:uncharacterized protein (DUF885 family)
MNKLVLVSLAVSAACSAGPAPVAPAPAPPPPAPAVAEAPPAPPAPSDLEVRQKAFAALLAEHWEYTLKRSPEMASSIGDRRYNDKWSDRSPEAIAADLAAQAEFLKRFEAIKPDGFAEQDALNHRLITRQLRERLDFAKYEEWLMPVNQFGGVHLRLPQLVAQLPFKTVKDYEDYLTRLTNVPTVFAQTQALMEQGAAKQLVPPRLLLGQVLSQTEKLAAARPADSPFALPLKKFPADLARPEQDRLSAAILAAIQDKVLPSYRGFAAFVKTRYLPRGRTGLGYWALPDGDARYAARIKEMTTLDLAAADVHELGLREVARIEAEQTEIATRLGFKSLAALKQHVRTDRKLKAKDAAGILAAYQHYTDEMYAKLPQLFGHLPKGKMIIEAVESFREKEAAGANYSGGTEDGSRPGAVQVNTYHPTERLMLDAESIAYHEGVPGHHLQIALQRELGHLPPFRRHARFTAFSEGWGLYAERLGKDVGLYSDPYNDYGRLQSEMLRAIRLVVDTGIHSKKWSREQVVKFFHDHSTIDEPSVQAETDRYIANPGQALAYKIGQLTISKLRDRAREALGAGFDLRAFHDEVLGAGALPLDILEQRIDAWIAKAKPAK